MTTLTETAIKALKATENPYKRSDEKGLFMLITPAGGRLWRFKYRYEGREKLIGLGSYPEVSLKIARERRDEARKNVALGIDPSAKRQAEKASLSDTFESLAREWMELQRNKLAPATFAKAVWIFEKWVFPYIGNRAIAGITAPNMLALLRRIETKGKHETAHRTKQRCGQVFRFAVTTGRADVDPTAALRGALAPVVTTKHAAITEPARVGELLRAIDGFNGQPSTMLALRLAPLVFVRPGELRRAEWSEFTLDGKEPEWRIPAEKMKMRESHIVPLSRQAVALLRELLPVTGPEGLVFPSVRTRARPISENTINAALRSLGYASDEMTGHGFRSLASTLLNEQNYHPDLIELQLAHKERNQVRAAYNKATRLPERRQMMQAWSDYLDRLKAGNNIVPLHRTA
jgi:integrase